MKKFKVTLYYHTSATVTVEAEDEDEAKEAAYDQVDDKELLEGLQEDDDPDVTEITSE